MAVDSRSDQFSLGIVLYECLTGQRLFLGDDEWQTIRLICESAVAAPSRLRPELGADVDDIARTLLAHDPAARYATTAAAEDALRRLAPSDDAGAAELRALVARLDAAPTTPSQPAVITLDADAPRTRMARANARVPPLLVLALLLGLFGALFPGDPSTSLRLLRRRPRPAVAVLLLANRSQHADERLARAADARGAGYRARSKRAAARHRRRSRGAHASGARPFARDAAVAASPRARQPDCLDCCGGRVSTLPKAIVENECDERLS